MTVDNFYSIYSSLSVSKAKVLNLLKEPNLSVTDDEVYQYLKRFIGNMSGDELRTFLRFVTGSLVISVPNIDVIFNSLNGLGRRPVSQHALQHLSIHQRINLFQNLWLNFELFSLIQFTHEDGRRLIVILISVLTNSHSSLVSIFLVIFDFSGLFFWFVFFNHCSQYSKIK